MYIRPRPPYEYVDAHHNQIISEINNHRLIAGPGVSIRRNQGGTVISVPPDGNQSCLNFCGTYNFASSYHINDVVFVDPNQTYHDESGSAIPTDYVSGSRTLPIVPGLWVCSYPIAGIGIDYGYLTGSVAPNFAASGQSITSDFSNTFRHYQYNVYYPIYPVIPGGYVTYVSESSWTTIANQTYWLPLAPMAKVQYCQGSNTQTFWANGIRSGSVFDPYYLPYSSSSG